MRIMIGEGRRIPRAAFLAWLALAACGVPVAAHAQAVATDSLATLAGVVRDSANRPIANADVVLRELPASGVHTNADGSFLLAGVPPGAYEVWFRRAGYTSTQYAWVAVRGQRTDLAVRLGALPHTLDPVVVRAAEDRRMRGHSSISGVVVDSLGAVVPDAEVQLVGAARSGLTRSNGAFVFSDLPVGTYVVRVRKLGYAPNVLMMELGEGDSRDVAIRIRQLAIGLEPVVVNERSGYGSDQRAWDELESRRRWRDARTLMVGPEEVKRYRSMPLDIALTHMDLDGAEAFARMAGERRPSLSANVMANGAPTPMTPLTPPVRDNSCILLNGRESRYEPLSRYSANEIEMIEVYPGQTELTGTVASHMTGPCTPVGLLDHPTYFVIWLRGASR